MAVQTLPWVGPAPPGGPDRLRLLKFLSRYPWLVTAALGAVVLASPVVGGDLAAQEFHTWAFRAHDAILWNNNWYSGHLLSGYSLLFPPVAAVVGTRLLGVLAAIGAAAAASALLGGPRAGRGARVGGLWFAVGTLVWVVVGQMPFGLGVALGLSALLAVDRRHPWLAVLAALGASLASPLAGAFVVMTAVAWCADIGARRVAPLASAAMGVAIAWSLGGGGFFPFPFTALLTLLIFTGLGLVLVRRPPRTLTWWLLLYTAAALLIFAVPNPVGGNITRLAALIGGPLAAVLLGSRRQWRALAVLAVPLACWQLWPAVTAIIRSQDDPSSQAAYYTGLDRFLRTQDPAQGRVEIPTLRQHWESYYVARVFPIARGWERQIDLRDNKALYRPDLTANDLHDWLVQSGVGLVALPDAPLDHWSQAEAGIIAAGQPWLQPVWSDAHWRVWRVADSPGLVGGDALLTRLGLDSFDLSFARAGTSVVRVHWSLFFKVTSGEACLRPAPGGWTTVEATSPGLVTVGARWSFAAALRPSSNVGRCS